MSLPIVLDRVTCSTEDSLLLDCAYSTSPSSRCNHGRDVGVRCRDAESLSNNDVFISYALCSFWSVCVSVSVFFP